MKHASCALALAAVLALPRAGLAEDAVERPLFEFGPEHQPEESYREADHDKRDFALSVLADVHGHLIGARLAYERARESEETVQMACINPAVAGLDALLVVARQAELDLRAALAGDDVGGVEHQLTLLRISGQRADEMGREALSCDDPGHAGGCDPVGPADPVFGLQGRPWYVAHPLAVPGLEFHGADDPRTAPGKAAGASVQLGPHARLDPGLALSTVADSNVTFSADEPRHDLRVVLLPHIRLTVDSDAVFLGLQGEYGLDKVTGVSAGGETEGNASSSGLDRLADGRAGVDVITTPRALASLVAGDHLLHLTSLAEASGGVEGDSHAIHRLGTLSNRARVGAELRPSSALTFTGLFHVDLGRHSLVSIAEGVTTPAALHSQFLDLSGSVAATWRFLPHTQLYGGADAGRLRWSPTALVTHHDAVHWRVRGGLEGDLSRRVGVRFVAGYSGVDAEGTAEGDIQGPRGILGDVWVIWRPRPTQQLSAGMVRDSGPVHLGDHLLTTSATVRYQGAFGGQLLPSAEVWYGQHEIRGDVPRDDHELRARVALGLAPDERFRITLHYDLRALVASTGARPFEDHRVGLTLELGAPGADLPWLSALPRSI